MKNTILIVALCFVCTFAYGSGNHERNHHDHTTPVVINGVDGINGLDGTNGIDGLNGLNGIDGLSGTNGKNRYIGQALGMATSHPFSSSTPKWQASLVGAVFEDAEAISFGMARKLCNKCVLFTGTIGVEQGYDAKKRYGATFGGMWTF